MDLFVAAVQSKTENFRSFSFPLLVIAALKVPIGASMLTIKYFHKRVCVVDLDLFSIVDLFFTITVIIPQSQDIFGMRRISVKN